MSIQGSNTYHYQCLGNNNYQSVELPVGGYKSHDEVILRIASEKISELVYQAVINPPTLAQQLCAARLEKTSPLSNNFLKKFDNQIAKQTKNFVDYLEKKEQRQILIENLTNSIFEKLIEWPNVSTILSSGYTDIRLSDYQPYEVIRKPLSKSGITPEFGAIPFKWSVSISGDKNYKEALSATSINYTISDSRKYEVTFTYKLKNKEDYPSTSTNSVATSIKEVKIENQLAKKFLAFADYIEDIISCPIAFDLPESPVLAADGRIYEEALILAHFKNSNLSPMTGLEISKEVVQNHRVKALIPVIEDIRNNINSLVQSNVNNECLEGQLNHLIGNSCKRIEEALSIDLGTNVEDIASKQIKEAISDFFVK